MQDALRRGWGRPPAPPAPARVRAMRAPGPERCARQQLAVPPAGSLVLAGEARSDTDRTQWHGTYLAHYALRASFPTARTVHPCKVLLAADRLT